MIDNQRGEQDRSTGIETWKPSLAISVVWTLLSILLTIGSFIAFIGLDAAISGAVSGQAFIDVDQPESGAVSVSMSGPGLLLLILAGTEILLVHEGVHGLAFRYFGGRPVFGAAVHNKMLPVLYCSAPGYRFTRAQFAVIVLAPAVVITALGLVLMPLAGLGLWLTVPMAINFGGAVGDFWFAGMLMTKPPGTMIEDLKDGLRFQRPEPAREQ